MNEETTPPFKADKETLSGKESKAFGISLRGWLALLLTITVCFMSAFGVKIIEPLYTMAVMALSFYFGKMSQPQQQAPTSP